MSEDALLQPTEGPDPKIGMVLQDRYKIVKKIGEGGMGAVYEGEHVLIKRRVAIKCLHAQFAQNPEIVARFHREALAATSIGHQNIVEVTDMGRFDDGSVFMVLEYLIGRDFSHDIDHHGAQQLGKVVHIMEQICNGLSAAHAKGIIHRDLKPENVYLIDRGGDPDFVKVLDFGISKFKDTGGENKGMTQTGTTLGTPYYMSPEQAQGKKDIDHRADIYSLGVIMFQALTAQYPFDDESYPMLVLKICTEPPPPLRMYRPDLPETIEQIIAKMLAKKADDRFPDCASVGAALAPFRNVNDVPVVDAAAPSTASMQSSMLAGATAATDTPAPALAAATPAPGMAAGTDPMQHIPGASKMPLMLGGAVVALLVGGVGIAAATGAFSSEPTPPAVLPTVTLPTVPTPTPTPSVPEQPEVRAPSEVQGPGEQVTVQIETTPEDAELYLDNLRIPNPFDGELPKTTEPRRLEARRRGYTTVVQDLVLQFPQRVRVRMRRGRGTDDQRSAQSRGRATTAMSASPMNTTTAPSENPTASPTMVDRIPLLPAMAEVAAPPAAMAETTMVAQPSMAEPTMEEASMRRRLKKIF